jgi:hypothetical protein
LDLFRELNRLRKASRQFIQQRQQKVNLLLVLLAFCLDELLCLQLDERDKQVEAGFDLLD